MVNAYISELFETDFLQLLSKANKVHQENFTLGEIQVSKLCNIKTGACPEDCSYCSQSVRHKETNLPAEPLMDLEQILLNAEKAKADGASRFCMGAAWRNPPSKAQFNRILEACRQVKAKGLETCMTLGMLTEAQCKQLKEAGLDYYNHNLDTSPEFYPKVITTRTYDDRLATLRAVANAGLKTCCGGIMGLGESRSDRVSFLDQLSKLTEAPTSIPLNQLVPMKGTPLESAPAIDEIEFIRTVAVTRIMFPNSVIRLAAGRESMSDSMQALCFFAGANSIFTGDKLLTTKNCGSNQDQQLFKKLNLRATTHETKTCTEDQTSD